MARGWIGKGDPPPEKPKAAKTKPCPGPCGGTGSHDVEIRKPNGDVESILRNVNCITCGGSGEVPA